jgi:protein-S-isoprenylcysteine O-methyltransferase Ste14
MLLGKIAFIMMVVVMTIIRRPHERRNKENSVKRDHKDRQEQVLLALVGVGSGFIPIVYILTNQPRILRYQLPRWAVGIGVVIMVVGLWFFWRSHKDLGRNWSVTLEVRDNHTLTTDGIYRSIRHPMYTAIWLLALAQPLLLHNWLAGFSGLVAFGTLYFLRVPVEERMMLAEFGPEYEQYMAQTGRLMPRLFRHTRR